MKSLKQHAPYNVNQLTIGAQKPDMPVTKITLAPFKSHTVFKKQQRSNNHFRFCVSIINFSLNTLQNRVPGYPMIYSLQTASLRFLALPGAPRERSIER